MRVSRPNRDAIRSADAGELDGREQSVAFRDEPRDGFDGVVCVVALGPDGHLIPLPGEPRHLQHALGVDLAPGLYELDAGRELLGRLYELRRGPSVDALISPDRRLFFGPLFAPFASQTSEAS